MSRENVHTVYDRLAAKGVFRANPANPDSVDPMTGQSAYKGPVPFPKMLFHPTGKRRVTQPAELVNTPFGPTRNNEQTELINIVVNNEAELQARLAEGWHQHPSDAVFAGFTPEQLAAGAKAPAKSSATRIASLEDEVARLTAELAAAKQGSVAEPDHDEDELD